MTGDSGLEELLQYLKATRGFDFTGYKRASLERRLAKRMDAAGVKTYTEYMDHLEVHPDEFARLFDTILINVTGFFRDMSAWDALRDQAFPQMLDEKGRGQVRVWTAGCASGEEAYTIAILLAEALGEEIFTSRVKIYATDADEDALLTGRHGIYNEKDLQSVPEQYRTKYFEAVGSKFAFRKDLRRSVVFGRHDLVQDAPISRLDLLVCRNTLMYFNADLQAQILRNFHFGLLDSGALFLGKAETLLTHSELFTPIDTKHRLFARAPQPTQRDRILGIPARTEPLAGSMTQDAQLRDAALDAGSVAQILIDADGSLVLANHLAREIFELGSKDFGRPIQDLELSYRPIELRSRIDKAYAERRSVAETDITRAHGNGGDVQSFDVTITPTFDNDGAPLGVTISFADVTRYNRLRQDLERTNQELETAYQELQSTNEELETTNEELQSTVEELETTNEELQSSNEELETTNEELQSTNAEIQAMNEEMRQRSSDLNRILAFSQSVVDTLHLGVVVVDRDLIVQSWNDRAQDLWGLRAEEVEGVAWSDLEMGLAVSELEDTIKRSLKGESQRITLTARNRRGREFECRVSCNPLIDPTGTLQGAVVLMEDVTG